MYLVTQRKGELNTKQDDLLASKRFFIERKPETVLFYELEEAIVLDVILDETHPAFAGSELDPDDWPVDANGKPAVSGQPNYSRIGMIKFRTIHSQERDDKKTLGWAAPMENTGVVEYPLMNETVVIGKYFNNYYYSRKLNFKSLINANADFGLERTYGGSWQNTNEYNSGQPYTGPASVLNGGAGDQASNPYYAGVLGNYFKFNPAVRALKHYEGDTIIESRFGSSVRFGSYDDNRGNDNGLGEYADHGGNPMLLIRNRQAPVKGTSLQTALINKGYVTESINNDGSSIHLTSGKTITAFKPTVKKTMFQSGVKEEQPRFSPGGATSFTYPILNGDQIVINSDRLIFSSKAAETFHYSKKRYAIVTDDEYTVDAQKQLVLTTNAWTVLNSPQIFLGVYGSKFEPALLGRSAVLWLYQLCTWMLLNVNSQIIVLQAVISHFHIDSKGGPTTPPQPPALLLMQAQLTSLQESQKSLLDLQKQLDALLSKRVFVSGGGGEPGADGG
jgi:hypothetical protein